MVQSTGNGHRWERPRKQSFPLKDSFRQRAAMSSSQNGQMAPPMIGKPVSGSMSRAAMLACGSLRQVAVSLDGLDALDAFAPTLRVCTSFFSSPSSWMDSFTRSARVGETRPKRPMPSTESAASGNPPPEPGLTGAGSLATCPRRAKSTTSAAGRAIDGRRTRTRNAPSLRVARSPAKAWIRLRCSLPAAPGQTTQPNRPSGMMTRCSPFSSWPCSAQAGQRATVLPQRWRTLSSRDRSRLMTAPPGS